LNAVTTATINPPIAPPNINGATAAGFREMKNILQTKNAEASAMIRRSAVLHSQSLHLLQFEIFQIDQMFLSLKPDWMFALRLLHLTE
jgi:hypothetical protein